MGLRHSKIDWENLESRTREEQEAFLSDWAKKFKDELVSDRKIKKGDHLMVYRPVYTHHLICTKVKTDGIVVMEYGVPPISADEAFGLLANLEKMGKIHEKDLTFEELEDMKVQKRVWPKKLRRYNRKESVTRAKTRIGENEYNCLTNNCEHFVVWCICGLSVSLQVKNWCTWAKELVKSLCSTNKVCVIQVVIQWGWQFLKINAESNEVSVFSRTENIVSFSLVAAMELLLCCYEVKKVLTDSGGENILTDNDRPAKVVETIAKTWFQLNLGTAGLFVGLPYGIIGSLVGGFVGIVAANSLGTIAKWYVESSALENYTIAAILKAFKKGFLITILCSYHQHGAA